MSDLISRQAAIDAIKASASKYKGFMEMEMYTDDDAVEAIEGVPSAQIEQRWIPVTERLPEKYIGEWLCCTDEGKIMILPYDTPGDGSKECVFYALDDDGYFYQTFNVTHWMPLPEPPKDD